MFFPIIIILTIILIITFIKIFPGKENGEKSHPVVITFAIIGVIATIAILLNNIPNKNDWKKENNSLDAYLMMQEFVKDKLKSPASAEFPSYYDMKDNILFNGNRIYTIKSFVDSQNGFGAMIRTNYIGDIEQTGKDNWKINSLNFY